MAKNTNAEAAITAVPRLPLRFDRQERRASVLRLIKHVSPSWLDSPSEINIDQLQGGVMNTLFKITKGALDTSNSEVEEAAILMRVYGLNTDQLVDREVEARVHAQLARMGLAAPLLARFENGLLYKFIPGEVCSAIDLREARLWRAIASTLGEWHAKLSVSESSKAGKSVSNGSVSSPVLETRQTISDQISFSKPSSNIWTEMQQWVAILPTATEAQLERKKTLQAELERSFVELERDSDTLDGTYVVGHNDLLAANVVVHATQDSTKELAQITFIDYEYARACPAALDLANHFSEWGGFECDYNMLPSRQTRRNFLEQYLKSYHHHAKGPKDVSPEEVEQLLSDVDRYRGIPGFRWSLHAMVEESITEIDFDWKSYAEIRLAEYWAWRREEDGSRQASGQKMPLREKMWALDK